MLDDRAGRFQQGFRPFLRLPLIAFRRQFQGRQTVDLRAVEDAREAHHRALQQDGLPFRRAVLAEDRPALIVQPVPLPCERVVDDGRGSAALLDAIALCVGLPHGHPARILKAVLQGRNGQIQPIHALVDRAGRGIVERHAPRRFPRLLPGSQLPLQQADDLF